MIRKYPIIHGPFLSTILYCLLFTAISHLYLAIIFISVCSLAGTGIVDIARRKHTKYIIYIITLQTRHRVYDRYIVKQNETKTHFIKLYPYIIVCKTIAFIRFSSTKKNEYKTRLYTSMLLSCTRETRYLLYAAMKNNF